MNMQSDPFRPVGEVRFEPPGKNVGHGNALFLAAMQEPGITRTKLRERAKAGEFPNLWAGAGQWLDLQGVR